MLLRFDPISLISGELSAADLPPEGDGGQSGGFDMSIDVFPRLHERDPYRRASRHGIVLRNLSLHRMCS